MLISFPAIYLVYTSRGPSSRLGWSRLVLLVVSLTLLLISCRRRREILIGAVGGVPDTNLVYEITSELGDGSLVAVVTHRGLYMLEESTDVPEARVAVRTSIAKKIIPFVDVMPGLVALERQAVYAVAVDST